MSGDLYYPHSMKAELWAGQKGTAIVPLLQRNPLRVGRRGPCSMEIVTLH